MTVHLGMGMNKKQKNITVLYTHKKEKQIFLMYKEIQDGAVAKSYMVKDLHISLYIRKPFLIYDIATAATF
jgi:hypothetical protein